MPSVTPHARLTRDSAPVTALEFCPGADSGSGPWLATASDGMVRLWDASRRSVRLEYEHSPSDEVLGLDFSADGAVLATLGDDRLARLWDTWSGRCLRTLECPDDDDLHVRNGDGAVALSDDGALLATSHALDFAVHVWDTSTGDLVRTLENRDLAEDAGQAIGLAFVPRRPSVLAVLLEEQGVRLWDMAAGGVVRSFGLPGRGIADAMRFSPDGTLLAAGGNHVVVWDARSGRVVAGGDTDDCGGTSAAAISPDGRLLATSGYSHGEGHLWDLPALVRCGAFPGTGDLLPHSALVTRLDGAGGDIGFSPDGRFIAGTSHDTTVVWRVTSPAAH